ncbi:MAG: heavy-metal-associated domain-containing protein [Flavobacteriales bacterium]|nr:heavy-metal-associated domain-containing protein [Flavobacteriales bacterium]
MTHRIALPALLASMIVLACGGAPEAKEQALSGVERTVKEVVISAGQPVITADLSIEGMTCEQMCGGAIRKALAQLGVEGTEIEMSEGEGPDHAIVTYDDHKVTDTQMVEAIQGLYDGQYKVVAVSITKQVVDGGSGQAEPAKHEDDKGVNAYSASDVVLPSVLAIISRLLRV